MSNPISATTRARFGASIVAIAPAVLLFAFVYHPYIANLTDKAAVAAALASDKTRWGLSHLAVGVGSGLAVLAFRLGGRISSARNCSSICAMVGVSRLALRSAAGSARTR